MVSDTFTVFPQTQPAEIVPATAADSTGRAADAVLIYVPEKRK